MHLHVTYKFSFADWARVAVALDDVLLHWIYFGFYQPANVRYVSGYD